MQLYINKNNQLAACILNKWWYGSRSKI